MTKSRSAVNCSERDSLHRHSSAESRVKIFRPVKRLARQLLIELRRALPSLALHLSLKTKLFRVPPPPALCGLIRWPPPTPAEKLRALFPDRIARARQRRALERERAGKDHRRCVRYSRLQLKALWRACERFRKFDVKPLACERAGGFARGQALSRPLTEAR